MTNNKGCKISLRKLVDKYKELDESERYDVRIEFEDMQDVECAVDRVADGLSSIWSLQATTIREALISLSEELLGCMIDLNDPSQKMLLEYFDHESHGQDMVYAGDYSLVEYDNQYFAVSQH